MERADSIPILYEREQEVRIATIRYRQGAQELLDKELLGNRRFFPPRSFMQRREFHTILLPVPNRVSGESNVY